MITLEAFNQQVEIAALYKDDKFVGLLKKCSDRLKEVAEAEKALDEREKDLVRQKKLSDVVLESQKTFNEQKSKAEKKNLEDAQHNQTMRDQILEDRKNVDADLEAAQTARTDAEAELKKATTARKSAETKLAKIEATLEEAEAKQAKWETRLLEIGLKAA